MQRSRAIPETGFNRRRHRSFVESKDGGPTLDLDTPEGLKARHKIAEQDIENLKRKWREEDEEEVSLIFHWSGEVSDFVDERNGPGKFTSPGVLDRVEYAWDDDASGAAEATVEWELADTLLDTHVINADGEEEALTAHYVDENIVGTVTAVAAGATGLTALVYLKPVR